MAPFVTQIITKILNKKKINKDNFCKNIHEFIIHEYESAAQDYPDVLAFVTAGNRSTRKYYIYLIAIVVFI